jgi:hypothetical protein
MEKKGAAKKRPGIRSTGRDIGREEADTLSFLPSG